MADRILEKGDQGRLPKQKAALTRHFINGFLVQTIETPAKDLMGFWGSAVLAEAAGELGPRREEKQPLPFNGQRPSILKPVSDQGLRKILPQAYDRYFEDKILSATQIWGKLPVYGWARAKGKPRSRT